MHVDEIKRQYAQTPPLCLMIKREEGRKWEERTLMCMTDVKCACGQLFSHYGKHASHSLFYMVGDRNPHSFKMSTLSVMQMWGLFWRLMDHVFWSLNVKYIMHFRNL